MTGEMRIGVGDGGWVQVEQLGVANVMHVRFVRAGDRLRASEVHVRAKGGRGGLDAQAVRAVSLSHVEAVVNSHYADLVRSRIANPVPDLSVLTTQFGVERPRLVQAVDRNYRLTEGPTRGLTDEFLASVARAYKAALARGERPNAAIRDQLGDISLKTVQRWVYMARQKKILERAGRQGAAG